MSLHFTTAARSHVGKIRQLNEDSYLAKTACGLWCVADGMGGHEAGDYASRLITSQLDALPPPASAPLYFRQVRQTLHDCHDHLIARAVTHGTCGSTVVVLLAFDRHFACLWAGDSRIYRLRNGQLEQLTRDHSVVQTMVDAGEITAEAARRHPKSNQILRAIGAVEPLEIEVEQGETIAGDRFLLCSDGLTGELDDSTLDHALRMTSLEAGCETLLAAVLETRASDNVTFVIVEATGLEDDDDMDSTLPMRR